MRYYEARNSIVDFLIKKYGNDWYIEKLWLSDHGSVCDCTYETTCPYKSRNGYWNAWAITRGKRTRWFYSYRLRKWMRGRLRLASKADSRVSQ